MKTKLEGHLLTFKQLNAKIKKLEKEIEEFRGVALHPDNWLSMGTDLNNPKFGHRICKYATKVTIGTSVGKYFGEWSLEHDCPHGRGVFINSNGNVLINFFWKGLFSTQGRFVICNPRECRLDIGIRMYINGDNHFFNTVYDAHGLRESGELKVPKDSCTDAEGREI
jgi:hypothetical protein